MATGWSKWEGKSWGTLGDSITEANGYQPLVASALGMSKVLNYGRSGCPMTAGGDTDEGATVNAGLAADASLDCITIYAGVNDYRLSKPMGNMGDRDVYTFIGAYQVLIESILTGNPACRLNLWTPLQRDKDGYDTVRRNDVGCLLVDYVHAVKQLGAEYALPVLDLYGTSGINRLTLPVFTSDGLHPNEAGHRRIAGMAIAFLQQL